jgi:hypothetical protein
MVGSFTDDRGTEPDWLGAIRGGYGNPLKKLRTDKPTSEVVEAAFRDALQTRKMLGSKATSNISIQGSITKFDCSYYFNREAHAHLLVNVVSIPSRTVLFSRSYTTDNKESGVGAGIFGDTDHLTEFAQRTLNQTIDKVLSDPNFMEALAGQSSASKAKSTRSVPERLRALEQLKTDGLINEEEYNTKRKEILREL